MKGCNHLVKVFLQINQSSIHWTKCDFSLNLLHSFPFVRSTKTFKKLWIHICFSTWVVLATASMNMMLKADPFLGKINSGAGSSSLKLRLASCLQNDSSKVASPCSFGPCEVSFQLCQWGEQCRLWSSTQAIPGEAQADFHTCPFSNRRSALMCPEKKP